MDKMVILGSSLLAAGILLLVLGVYLYPKVYRWTDCDQDTETNGWQVLKFIFGIAPILIVFGVYSLFKLSSDVFFVLLLLSPLSVFVLYHLKKVQNSFRRVFAVFSIQKSVIIMTDFFLLCPKFFKLFYFAQF